MSLIDDLFDQLIKKRLGIRPGECIRKQQFERAYLPGADAIDGVKIVSLVHIQELETNTDKPWDSHLK